MRTITQNFKIIVDKQNSLGYDFPKFLQEPADKSLIRITEQTLNFKFNSELNELYSFANGTKLTEHTKQTLGMIGLIPIHIFLNLEDAVDYYDAYINVKKPIMDDFFLNFDTEFKPDYKLFPFLEDSAGNCYWVDLNMGTRNYQKIYWTNTFSEQPDYAFDSLTSMFQTIAECYENNIITVDDERNLECDYREFYRVSKKNNPGITHWDLYLNP